MLRLVRWLFLGALCWLAFTEPACTATVLGAVVLAAGAVACCVMARGGINEPPSCARDYLPAIAFGVGAVVALAVAPAACTAAIPDAANKYRRDLVRIAQFELGLDAPIATLAGQIHQESRWNEKARSPVGAQGLTQFMPATADWMVRLRRDLAGADPFNPIWAMRAMLAYDAWHLKRIQARGPCDQWAMALAAYNGGLGWLQKDIRLASAKGADPLAWFDSVERHNSGRSTANFKENRHYSRTILLKWEPLYEREGWGTGVCT